MEIVSLFILGLFIGSFLNVVIDRVPRGETFIKGQSHCDFCKHTLSWYDLVPFFSFLFLRGKCRYCKKFIGWKYPIIELTTGVGFAGVYLFSGLGINNLLFFLAIVSCLIVVFYTDLFSGIIPDSVLAILFLVSALRIIFLHQSFIPYSLSAIGAGLFFLTIFLLTRGKGMGFGDVKYAVILGLLLGFPVSIVGLYVAFLTGAFVALILIVAGKKRFRQTIAFGPFLVLGTIAGLFWGQGLWTVFLHILGIQ